MNNSLKQIKMDNNYISIDYINSSMINILKTPNPLKDTNSKINQTNIFSNISSEYIKLSKNIDNLFSKITPSNFYNKKYKRTIEYINKLIISGKEIKFNKSICEKKEIISKITLLGLYIIKNNILNRVNLINQKFIKILILLTYSDCLPTENFIFIINTFLDIGIELLVKEEKIIDNNSLFNKSCLSFINDLFCALISIPHKLINEKNHLKLIDQLITILDKNIFSCPYNLRLNKLDIWMKLLGNKIINIDDNYSFNYNKIISFLVKIYKYNFDNLFLYKDIYEKSAVSFDYYVNSLDFLIALFKQEQKQRFNNDFKIKNGFYIYNNIPLRLNNIQFKSKVSSFSLIFSFKLTKIENNKKDSIILNIVNNENKIILQILLTQPKNILKIIGHKAVEWNTNFKIDLNKEYFICLPQEKKTVGKKMHLYISKKNDFEHLFSTSMEIPDFDQPFLLKLGESNFEGIIGDLVLINKKIRSKDIVHLFNLKEDYADIITSINYRNDLNYKKKKYPIDDQDINYFTTLKYQCLLIITTKQIIKIPSNKNSFIIKPYGELKYIKNNNHNIINDPNNNNNISISLYNPVCFINNFIHQHPFEYLTFQLHKINSLSENNINFNYYLYKTLYFALHFIGLADEFIFILKNTKFQCDPKFSIFFFSLSIILNSKTFNFELNEKIREILLEYGKILIKKEVIFFQKLNFDILFDSKLFRSNLLINYNELFNQMIWHLKNNNKNNNVNLFYKILLFDDFFETTSKNTKIKHRPYMNIISTFITNNKKSKHKNLINEFLIHYIVTIKNPKKMYHYLKIIYHNFNHIKDIYKENGDFFNYLITNYNKLDNYNCKYCRNIQILSFLLYDIIANNNDIFSYTPYGFMKNPNYNFIRCIFIKTFKINNAEKLKFIKSSEYYDNEIDLLIKCIPSKDNIDIFSLIDYSHFIPNLDSLIKYYIFLYQEYLTNDDSNILKLLKKSIKLILDFLDKIIKIYSFEENANKLDNSEDKKHSKDLVKEFIIKLFTCSGIKLLFILYFNIFSEEELKDLKNLEKYILFSINNIYNPFYFYLLLPFFELNTDYNLSINYKSEILKMIITNIILLNNTFKINSTNVGNNKNSNETLILNSILILVKIYNLTKNKVNSVLILQTEKSIIIYLKYILENNFMYSKYIFNINLIDENVISDEQNKNNNKEKIKKKNIIKEKTTLKFLSEITLDIIFYLLSKNEDSELITLLYNNLNLKKSNSIFYEIDEYFMLDINGNKNISIYNNNIIQFLNSPKISTNYCSGVNVNSILFSTYFFIYFYYKYKSISNSFIIKQEIKNKINELNNKALEFLFKDSITLFNKYIKKIKKTKTKIFSNEILFKIYYILFEHFSTKYKDNKFQINEVNKIFSYFENFLKTSKEMNKMERDKNFRQSMNCLENYSYLETREPSMNASLSHTRKTSFFPEENSLFQINENEKYKGRETVAENNNFKYIKKIYKRLRSFSNDFDFDKKKKEINIFNDIMNAHNNNININININNNKMRTPKIRTKESTKHLDSDNTTFTSNTFYNYDYSSETNSENSYYDNLFSNSNYKCNNIINNTEEKQTKRKSAFYLNSKKFKSSICLNPNYPSSNKSELESSDYSFKDENDKKNKLSIDDINQNKNNYINNIQINIIEEKSIEIKDTNKNENEKEDNHKFILDKIKEKEISFNYYKEIASSEIPKWSKILLNPKREIMLIFKFVFRKYIYNDIKFKKLKSCFKLHFKNKYLERSIPEEENYSLNYPTKLKNFTCTDYYRPFLKPILNYFDSEYFYNSHQFLKQSIIEKEKSEIDDIGKIKYEKLYLIIKKDSDLRYKCENISNKGSIFGHIHLHNSLMVFVDYSERDNRLLNEKNNSLFYLFSSDVNDRLKGKNKYIIIFYSEIKEIILRRYCFTDIAYEIFLKDNRSYFFNFYDIDNRKHFIQILKKKIDERNKEKQNNKNNAKHINYVKLNEYTLIDEPKTYFEKKDIKASYVKKEITNFQYLLLVNKFSSRTYNDNNQYLIFPLLYMDLDKKIERDLAKPICLNKKLANSDVDKFRTNYENFGYHFNSHYTTMAYILYYLMRLNPFTNCQIKLQSGHFDAPARMFTSLENLLLVFQITDENRELCPEFFYSYESFLNLNYNDFGYIFADKRQIHNFNTNQNIGIIQFIIDLRNILEKRELSPWIDNIFGYKQLNDNIESFNTFPTYSYEQYNDLQEEKEEIKKDIENNVKKEIINKKIQEIRNKIELLSLGLVPIQLFKGPHPYKESKSKMKKTSNSSILSALLENNNKIENEKNILRKKYNINKYLKEFINKGFRNLLYVFNYNKEENIKLIFIYENQIKIFNYLTENSKDKPNINIDIDEEINLLEIKPYKNIFIELYQNVFILCRLINRTLLIFSEKQKYYIEWPCIITAIELLSYSKLSTNLNNDIYFNEIIIGDEDGYLTKIEVFIEYFDKKKEFKIKSLNNNFRRNKAHYSYINGIIYCKRLNIIISSCGKGYITINNGYSFDILNIIKIDKNLNILDYKISEYDLLYIYTNKYINNKCIYELYCYTLNGIKIKKLDIKKEINNFYNNNTSIYIVYRDGNIREYDCATFEEKELNINTEELKDIKNFGDVYHSVFFLKMSTIFIIFNNQFKNIQI